MPNLGINITELSAQGVPQIEGENALLPGFMVISERAPDNNPVLITSMQQFKRLFGNYISTGYGAYVLEGFFANEGRKAYISRVIGTSGAQATFTINDRAATPLATLKVEAGYKGKIDKGTWGNNLSVVITDNLNDVTKFNLEVKLSGETKEIWYALTPSTAVTVINSSTSGSEFIKVTDMASTTVAPNNNPANGTYTLAAGSNPNAPVAADFTGVQANKTGLYAFDGKDISHLANAESQDSTHLGALRDYCSTRGTILGVASTAQSQTVSGAKTFGAALQVSNAYLAIYLGWVSVTDPIGSGPAPLKWISNVGHVLGVYARTFNDRGVHKAPAGVVDGQMRGVFDIDIEVTSDTDITDLATNGVNTLKVIPGYGRVVLVSRTASKDTRWRYVNVRNLFNYIKRQLKTGLAFVQQEPNDETLRRRVRDGVVIPFLRDLFLKGAFSSGKFEDLVSVVCDSTNNPPSEINLGNFHLDITLYPGKPAETILITVAQQVTGASSASER